jgi:hypothetical protein
MWLKEAYVIVLVPHGNQHPRNGDKGVVNYIMHSLP